MLYPVIIKNKKGKIIKKISNLELKKRHWANFKKENPIKSEKEKIFIKKKLDMLYPTVSNHIG